MRHVAIVGGGLAAARSAAALREAGFAGRVSLLSAEQQLPYDRPPLSKQVLLGETDSCPLDVAWPELDVELYLGRTATGLRPGVLETDGGPLAYDGLVIATGAEPVRLPGAGRVLRSLDDALALRARCRPGARVVVVGAGWVGAEVATAAARAGCRTTVLEAGAAPLAAALPVEAGALTAAWYAAAGVELRTGTPVAAVEPDRVVLRGGEAVPADVAVVGVGVRPATRWLSDSGLALDGGAVAVDEHLQASWPGVVAAGDCAARWSPRVAQRVRTEHWDDALHAPSAAIRTLLGAPTVHDPVPYVWSEQLGHFLQLAGNPAGADRVVHRSGGPTGGWSLCWLREGALVAVLAADRPKDLLQGRRAIAQGARPDPGLLADPALALRSAVPA